MVRFVNIAKSSIWHDEGYTMMLAPQSPLEILARTGRDVHPPLYYLVLHYWMLVFGNSETAARGLSAVFMLGVVIVGYLLVKRLFANENYARLAALFLALAPFLVRYSQEARMYGMVAFVLLVATYAMVRALEAGSYKWWGVYALALSAGLYTHYYSVFMILVHWLYVATISNYKARKGVFNLRWWGANILAAALFLPWLPTAYAQFTRVQASFWIPKPNLHTLPNTFMQFLIFNNTNFPWLGLVVTAFLVLLNIWALVKIKLKKSFLLLVFYSVLSPGLVVLLSYKRPIYVDRYFVFAAVAFYMLLAVSLLTVFAGRRLLASIAITLATIAFGVGIQQVYYQSNHQMRQIGEVVNHQYRQGDDILSGELYTYFDFSYYNHTGYLLKLWSKNGVNGYGESSLLYDRADQIVVHNLSDLHPASGFVWVVGKTGAHDYYDKVPSNWTPVGLKYTAGYSAVQEYQVTRPRNQ
jgi:uncharacterized membrane protein